MAIERFEYENGGHGPSKFYKSPSGSLVRFSDYSMLALENETLRAELEAANTKHQQQLDLQWDAAKAVESERDDLSVRLSEHRELVAECNTALLRMQLERDEAREDAALSHKHYTETRAELAELRARVKEVPRTTEWHIAMREANQIHDADAYFAARSEMLDSGHNRHLFEAGYQRGFDAGEKVYAGTAADCAASEGCYR